jgi:hypothetical protein
MGKMTILQIPEASAADYTGCTDGVRKINDFAFGNQFR